MGKPAARVGDMHSCPAITRTVPHVGGGSGHLHRAAEHDPRPSLPDGPDRPVEEDFDRRARLTT
jgi:hypothetical protein